MVRELVIASLAFAAPATVGTGGAARVMSPPQEYPLVAVRISERDFFRRYERVSVFVESTADGYLTVFRVDTDGRARIIYPRDHRDDNFVVAGNSYRIPNPYGQRGDHAFVVDDYPGVGYVFAVVSPEPFNYQPYVRNDHWEWRAVAHDGRITGDPYVGFVEVVEPMLPTAQAVWSFDVVPYFVEKQHPYPRFLCYECHTYVPHPAWDTYGDWCPRFRILVFEDAFRYPTVVYPATRVVGPTSTVRPRFVIQPRSQADPFITQVPRDPDPTRRRDPERGVGGADVGGVGTVPVPVRVPARRVIGEEPSVERRESPSGGIGGFLRRLLGGAEEDGNRRQPTVQREGEDQSKQVRPKLERREPTGTVDRTKREKPEGQVQPRSPTRPASTPTVRTPERSSTPATTARRTTRPASGRTRRNP